MNTKNVRSAGETGAMIRVRRVVDVRMTGGAAKIAVATKDAVDTRVRRTAGTVARATGASAETMIVGAHPTETAGTTEADHSVIPARMSGGAMTARGAVTNQIASTEDVTTRGSPRTIVLARIESAAPIVHVRSVIVVRETMIVPGGTTVLVVMVVSAAMIVPGGMTARVAMIVPGGTTGHAVMRRRRRSGSIALELPRRPMNPLRHTSTRAQYLRTSMPN